MKDLLSEIESYWTTRAEGYSEVNHKELNGMQKGAWLEVLESQFPKKAKEELKILDIGTGPGFFPVILAGAGYRVVAVDYTQEMLDTAKKNAGELCRNITFYKMDAQNLEFEDDVFDVVISRNLTWNLKEPERAYREWCRVLKPGGKLLNFDANWYGYLYDDEKRQSYEEDRRSVESKNLDDHYLCTDIDRMEKIALQMPLSAINRPSWDRKFLKENGFSSVAVDTGIWNRVWSQEEKLNYHSTPMFMVSAVKEAGNNWNSKELKPGEDDAQNYMESSLMTAPGTKKNGFLKLGGGEFALPYTVICGSNPGKTVLITAAVHAGEHVGIQAAIELAESLEPEKINGSVIIVKTVCRREFEERGGSICKEDKKNLNRVFPGNPDGTRMERLAYAVVQTLQSKADFYIDIHSGDDFEELTPYIYYAGKGDADVVAMSKKMAEQADVPYMVKSDVASGGSYNYAASCGIPSVLIERGQMGGWTQEEVYSTRKDVHNILCCLGIYDELRSYSTYYPMEIDEMRYQSASVFGLWYPEKKPGDLIKAGEFLGCTRDYEGNILEKSYSDLNGVILYQVASLQVLKDGPMIAYGKFSSRKDERKEKITNYWTKRSDSFMEQRRAELHSDMADKWMKEISTFLPKGKLKILDVGCGAGFFSILLSKLGHEVTGIDLTPDMITHSRELAKEEGASCTFKVMDAENPDFTDESFDVIVTRNLTWTLPDAARAYKEWIRVLKTGGVLINADANYGADNFTDTTNLPSNHAHFTVGDAMMNECEEIKRQLPISSYIRPAWDVEILGKLGVKKFSIDTGISERIYTKKDEFYNPTPMFLLCVEK